jgi:hypothetical protein
MDVNVYHGGEDQQTVGIEFLFSRHAAANLGDLLPVDADVCLCFPTSCHNRAVSDHQLVSFHQLVPPFNELDALVAQIIKLMDGAAC